MSGKIFIVLFSFLSGMIGSIFFTVINNKLYHKKFAVIRMEKVLSSHVEKFGSKQMSDDKRLNDATDFSDALNKVISKIENEEKVILLVKGAVITMLPDYTEKVINDVEESLGNRR